MSGQTGTGAGRSRSADMAGDPQPTQVVQKRDFVDRVVAATGTSRTQARPIIDATLDQLGRAFSAGETLVVPPFGRARISRSPDQRGGEVITLRLRRKLPAGR